MHDGAVRPWQGGSAWASKACVKKSRRVATPDTTKYGVIL